MVNEHYLEYLALTSMLHTNINESSNDFLYSDGEKGCLNLIKLKERISKLQKDILEDYLIEPYVINSNSKEY
jgi:hypothetical protein